MDTAIKTYAQSWACSWCWRFWLTKSRYFAVRIIRRSRRKWALGIWCLNTSDRCLERLSGTTGSRCINVWSIEKNTPPIIYGEDKSNLEHKTFDRNVMDYYVYWIISEQNQNKFAHLFDAELSDFFLNFLNLQHFLLFLFTSGIAVDTAKFLQIYAVTC